MGAVFTDNEASARPFPSFYELQAITDSEYRSVLPKRAAQSAEAVVAAPAVQPAQCSVQLRPQPQPQQEVFDVDSHSSSCESTFSYDSSAAASDDEWWDDESADTLGASYSRRKYGDWDRLLTAIDIAFEADRGSSSNNMRKRASMSSDHSYLAAKRARFSNSSSGAPARSNCAAAAAAAAFFGKPEYYSSAQIADEPHYLKQAVMPLMRAQSLGRRGPRGQSRYKGVCITRAGKWRAVIYIGRKQKYLGVFDTEIEAAHAYDESAREHFGSGAKLNFTSVPSQTIHWRCHPDSPSALASYAPMQGLCA